jgi:hypothetical protein
MRYLILLLAVACSSPQQPQQPTTAQQPAAVAERCRPCPADAGALPPPADVAPPAPALTTAHPRIMLPSQAARLRGALAAPTPAAARWRTATLAWIGGADLWGFDAWNAALLSALTGTPAGCTKAVAAIDAQVTAAETRISAGAAPEVAGDSYLQVGEMIGDLALVYDWCFATVTAQQRSRWTIYANQAVGNVWSPSKATWGGKLIPWTGWSIDDPGDNYYYSFLRATMLLGLATDNADWIAKFRERLIGRLIPYMTVEQADGGSREGTGYGVALRHLFELYALWEWSTGERLADLTPHTRATLATVLQQMLPGGQWKAPTGDQSRDSTAAWFDYDRAELLELAALYPDTPEARWAVSALGASSVPIMGSSFMYSYDFIFAPTGATPNAAPLVRYAAGIGQLYARTSWASSATWINLTAGPFTQSHAHEDQGELMIYRDGWLATDAVIWSRGGVRQSTSPVGTTAAHSLVRIDMAGVPVPQREGTAGKLLALHVGPGYVFSAADLTATYAGTAAVQLVRRQVLWLQPDLVLVHDHLVTAAAAALTWQLVVPAQPVIAGPLATVGRLRVTRLAPAAGAWAVYGFEAHPDFVGGFRLDGVQPGGDRVFVTAIQIDSTAAVPAVTWSDVGVSWGGVTLGAGMDRL